MCGRPETSVRRSRRRARTAGDELAATAEEMQRGRPETYAAGRRGARDGSGGAAVADAAADGREESCKKLLQHRSGLQTLHELTFFFLRSCAQSAQNR